MAKKEFKYCPYDASELIKGVFEGEEYQMRGKADCGYIHWENPIPAVAVLIPTTHTYWEAAGLSTNNIPNDGIIIVQRGVLPCEGGFCLPGGFIKRRSHPKQQGAAESLEETGLKVRIEKLAGVCLPNIESNVLLHLYIARPIGGVLQADSDAVSVQIVTKETLPEICFSSHFKTICDWYEGKYGTLTGVDL